LAKDIDHKSNLYGVLLDAQGYIVSADAKAGDAAPVGMVYDAADMPYYLRIREDGTGLHAAICLATRPRTVASGCRTRSPSYSSRIFRKARRSTSCSSL